MNDAWFLDFINSSTDEEVMVAVVSEIIRKGLIAEWKHEGIVTGTLPVPEDELEKICLRLAKRILKKQGRFVSEEEVHKILVDEAKRISKRNSKQKPSPH